MHISLLPVWQTPGQAQLFCDDEGTPPRVSSAQQQREAIFSLARSAFFDPRSFLRSTALHEHKLVARMAVTQTPEIIFDDEFPRAMQNDAAILKTALIAAKRLEKTTTYERILQMSSGSSLDEVKKEMQKPASGIKLWMLQVQDNPQLFPLLCDWLRDEEEIIQVALEGDGLNLGSLSLEKRSRLDLVSLAMRQYPEAYRLAPLGVQCLVR